MLPMSPRSMRAGMPCLKRSKKFFRVLYATYGGAAFFFSGVSTVAPDILIPWKRSNVNASTGVSRAIRGPTNILICNHLYESLLHGGRRARRTCCMYGLYWHTVGASGVGGLC